MVSYLKKIIIYTTVLVIHPVIYCREIRLSQYSPNFDIALGKNGYAAQYYNDLLVNLNSKESHWGILGSNPNPLYMLLNFCRKLYEKNILANLKLPKTPRIPLVVHQIWLGSPLPEKYKLWQKTWQSIPGWGYKLWTEKEVQNFNFINKDIYFESKNYGQRADILRLEILYQFGGLYVDMDFECLNGDMFTILNYAYDFYTALHPLDFKILALANGLIGAKKGHPVLRGCIEEIRKEWQNKSKISYREIVMKTGPGVFTKTVFKFADRGYKDIILPPSFFYPIGFSHFKLLKNANFQDMKTNFGKHETIAIHWWEGSWSKPSATVR